MSPHPRPARGVSCGSVPDSGPAPQRCNCAIGARCCCGQAISRGGFPDPEVREDTRGDRSSDRIAAVVIDADLVQMHGLRIVPSDVSVKVGSTVTWRFRCAPGISTSPIRWTLWFEGPPPLGGTTIVRLGLSTSHSFRAEDPGEWKYGVRVTGDEGRVIGEDDPWLRVTPVTP